MNCCTYSIQPRPRRAIRAFKTLSALLGAASALALPGAAQADTLHVPAAYATIQDAVTAASSGDTILVADGTYSGAGNTDIDPGGKSLTFQSVHGAAATIIECGGVITGDGSGDHRGFYIHSGETAVTIQGFTIQDGYTTSIGEEGDAGSGGGICIHNNGVGTVTVTDCALLYSEAANGGGLYAENDSSGAITVTGCTFTDYADSNGGGFYNTDDSEGGSITLTDCRITACQAQNQGGGVYNEEDDFNNTITLNNCVLLGNFAAQGMALYDSIDGIGFGDQIQQNNCTLTQNTLWGPEDTDDFAVEASSGPFGTIFLLNTIAYGDNGTDPSNGEIENGGRPLNVTNCDVQGGYSGAGNIDADPLFVASEDLHLQAGSPCLGAGTAVGAPLLDFDGKTRALPPSIGAYDLGVSHAQILWNYTDGEASVWNVAADGTYAHAEYGPFGGWTAKSVADAPDGSLRLLWTGADGEASVWNIAADLSTVTHAEFGPFDHWAPVSLSAASTGDSHLLWDKTDGEISLWDIASDSSVAHTEYGPFTGWTAHQVADGPGVTDLLWTKNTGDGGGWTISGGAVSQFGFGPFPGWTATALTVGTDNKAQMLWDNADGTPSLWSPDFGTGVYTHTEFAPFSDWAALAVAADPNNVVHLLWNHTPDGEASLETLSGSVPTHTEYGPFSGWTPVALSAGP